MSQWHRKSKHTTHLPRVRASIEARLPLLCIENCGELVKPGQRWHVAHIIPASQGGRTTIANCGPAHDRCNLASGGRLGARVVNARKRVQLGRRKWV